jgi:hypothetical protein
MPGLEIVCRQRAGQAQSTIELHVKVGANDSLSEMWNR